jgi:SAM-dependent methyltransferase
MRDARDPVPWDYLEVVRRYLRPTDRVLDLGTGGGEKLLSLALHFATAIGIDASVAMVEDAQRNLAVSRASHVSFRAMRAEELRFADVSFDVVLNRHSVTDVSEAVRVLRRGGTFITQQVGPRNTQNICSLFGCGVGGEYGQEVEAVAALAGAFTREGCRVVCLADYDVRYWFRDIESLVFWHKAIPMPEDFDIEVHWRLVEKTIADYGTPQGIETNEHRELLIARKQ